MDGAQRPPGQNKRSAGAVALNNASPSSGTPDDHREGGNVSNNAGRRNTQQQQNAGVAAEWREAAADTVASLIKSCRVHAEMACQQDSATAREVTTWKEIHTNCEGLVHTVCVVAALLQPCSVNLMRGVH